MVRRDEVFILVLFAVAVVIFGFGYARKRPGAGCGIALLASAAMTLVYGFTGHLPTVAGAGAFFGLIGLALLRQGGPGSQDVLDRIRRKRARSRRRESERLQAVDDEEDDLDERYECPQCAELIKRRAKVCRFCGAKLLLDESDIDDLEERVGPDD